MRDTVLLRKQARIIMVVAVELSISEKRTLDFFCTTESYRQLSDPKYGLQLMNDGCIVENVASELSDLRGRI